MTHRVLLLSCLVFSAPVATAAGSSHEKGDPADASTLPDHRVYWTQLGVLRYNPLGLETQNWFMASKRLMDSDSVLFSDTFVAGGLGLKLNPAFVKAGPTVDLQPIAVLNLRLAYEWMQFFGTFDYLQSWTSPTDPAGFSDEQRAVAGEAGLNYVTRGHHFFVQPTLQAKAGPVAIRSKFAVEYWAMGVSGDHDGDGVDDTVWYDATLDTYVPASGYVMTDDTDILYLAGPLTAGVRFSGVWPMYDADQFPVEGAVPADFEGMSHMRVGPMVAWKLANQVTVLSILGWYLDHPNREGALPYILVGAAFTKDLLK